ncbi:hypothetical protein EXU48_00005 [Occultella glacieicola]|uniref:Flagellar hook-length control protein-like C-terminal domain-containing protein n=2 Tax=Occultella glacieicola TaxID=2518684 RepID=A0ABY2E830_9MICO|nr:hypothetical protein EXU48_00005 [Occultella glacieicola]
MAGTAGMADMAGTAGMAGMADPVDVVAPTGATARASAPTAGGFGLPSATQAAAAATGAFADGTGPAPTPGPTADPGTAPALVTPLTAPAPHVPVTTTAHPAVGPSTTPWPAAAQLLDGLLTLRSTPAGQHTLTINIAPDHLGPIAVRAHITAEGIRIELQTPDAGREALRAILPDLRRDLAAGGLNATLDLDAGPRDHPGDGARAGADPDDAQRGGRGPGEAPAHRAEHPANSAERADRALHRPGVGRATGRPGGGAALDVLL